MTAREAVNWLAQLKEAAQGMAAMVVLIVAVGGGIVYLAGGFRPAGQVVADETNARVVGLQTSVAGLQTDVGQIKNTLAEIKGQGQETHFKELDADVRDHEHRLSVLEGIGSHVRQPQ